MSKMLILLLMIVNIVTVLLWYLIFTEKLETKSIEFIHNFDNIACIKEVDINIYNEYKKHISVSIFENGKTNIMLAKGRTFKSNSFLWQGGKDKELDSIRFKITFNSDGFIHIRIREKTFEGKSSLYEIERKFNNVAVKKIIKEN